MRISLAILLAIIVCLPVAAQPPETIYPGRVIASGPVDDASYGPFNIGFTFNFCGTNYTKFYVNSNGMILFGTGSSESAAVTIPTAAVPNNYIAPFWDDLYIDPTGKILYDSITIGAAPNRKLVVQFTNMGFYSPPPSNLGTFQVILYETTNVIQIQYRQLVDNSSPRTHGGTATIGLENATGTAGKLYSFMNPNGVVAEQAISFTPPGPNYTINSNAVYDGIYLTSNISLPEPGITSMISPPNDAVIGQDQTFSWSAASNAASYSLRLSFYSDLGSPTVYNTTDLSRLISGLVLDTVYYWGVYSINATGTTWSQINKFRTSSNPPLAAAPETDWVEKDSSITIQLDYSGGDASPKTGIITSLPTTGTLYQYNNGIKGAQISTVPTTLTDTSRKVIYTAGSTTGNGEGNFNFYIHDNTGDSPEAQVTINVSPPGIPDVLYVAKGSGVEIQFDIPMSDPTGKQNEFTVKVNGTPVTINSASLKTGDPNTIVLTLATPLAGTETVYVAYTAGTVTGATGGFLASFTDILVTLKSQTITFSQSLTKKFNDSPLTLTATASSGLGMTYSSSNLPVVTISGNVATFHSVGSSDITARQAGNATWAPARYIRTLTISKGDQTITFPALLSKTYGDPDFSPGASASSGLIVTYSSDNPAVATIVGSNIHITGGGTANITASQVGNSNWNAATDVQRLLTVNKANQTITFNTLPAKTFGDADFDPGATASSGLTVTYTSDNFSVATIVSGKIHITGAGTATITASQAGNSNYNPAADVPQTLTVNKADQTITFNSLPSKSVGDADFDPGATASSGLTVSYSSDNPSVATIVSGLIHIIGAGTANITASQAGNTNYNAAPDVQQPLTVNKIDQVITFPILPSKTYGDIDFDPGATASSGLTVSYTSDNPSVATIISGNIHIAGAGTATITASQAGDASYNAAPDVQNTLDVSKATLTVTADDKSKEYLAVMPVLTFTYTGFVNGDDESVIDVLPAIQTTALQDSPVGTYPINLSGGSDNNYTFNLVPGSLTVTKISQTITFTRVPDSLLVSDTFKLSATSSSGLEVLFESLDNNKATVSGNIVTGVERGSARIRAYNDGNSDYQPAEIVAYVQITSTHRDIMYLFTPNGDGFNDYWELPKLAEWGKCDVKVYNRWGKLVFSNPDYDNLWDGTSDGHPLPAGAYYFIIKTQNVGIVKGTVNIVR